MANAQLGAVVRYARELTATQHTKDQSDGELLRTFAVQNDQAAFTALTKRHGPLVLGVCRRVLHHTEDAEDAFQATFLLLAHKAKSIQKKESLASWLHGVAYRMARNAKRAARRRRKHEGQLRSAPSLDPAGNVAWREVQAVLDEEIGRLPEIYRQVFILCCLENRSRADVSRQLGVKEATVWSRLAQARQLLQQRLGRRGVSLSALLGALALSKSTAHATVSSSLVSSTVKAVLAFGAGNSCVVSAKVTALLEGGLKTMFGTKAKIATVLLLVAGAAAGGGILANQLPGAKPADGPQSVTERSGHGASEKQVVSAKDAKAPVATPSDARTLKDSKIGSEGQALLEFLRQRTLAAEETKVAALVRSLGDSSFAIREKATAEVLVVGTPAIPLLRKEAKGADAEAARRAGACLTRIAGGREGALPAAVIRLVAVRRPAGAAEALLNYLPVAYDEYVAEEGRNSLASVAVVGGTLEPILLQALSDRQSPLRRAAAAEAICRATGTEHRHRVRELLRDPEPAVRLRVALALTSRQDRDAIPVSIDVLDKVPPAQARQAEDVLYRLAEEKGPDLPFTAADNSWGQRRAAWNAWWQQHGSQIDLARLDMQGNTLILESTVGRDKEWIRVFELRPDGKALWELPALPDVTDALVVSSNRVLLAEWTNLCVTERDFKGRVLWKKKLGLNPLFVQRLPNGHTFIVDMCDVVEVDDAGQEVFRARPSNVVAPQFSFSIAAAQRLRDGQVVCFTVDMSLDEGRPTSTYFHRLDANGKELKKFLIGNNKRVGRDGNSDFAGMDPLPNGHVLIAHPNSSKVVEYDGDGQAVWEAAVPWPTAPKRLPNGNTRVVMLNPGVGAFEHERALVELDRAGKTVWKVAVDLPGPVTHLPNGHTLLIKHLFNPSGDKLVEFDRAGRVVWEYEPKGGLGRARRR